MRIGLTGHATARYRERVKPNLDPAQATAELRRLLDTVATIEPEAPEWAFRSEAIDPPDAVAMIGDGIFLPLGRTQAGGFVALTVVAHGHLGEVAREVRNRKAATRRFVKRAHRQKWREQNTGRGGKFEKAA